MNALAGIHGIQQCNAAGARRTGYRTEHEDTPPFGLVMLVFLATTAGGVLVSLTSDSIALGWMAGVGILAALGAAIDRLFCGAAALERRLSARSRARHQALHKSAWKRGLRTQWPGWQNATTPEWTSMSAYRRHPR